MEKKKKIALFYGNEEREVIDAKETIEDLVTELQSFHIEPEKVRKDRVTYQKTEYWFVNIEKDDKVLSKNSFDVVYIVDRLKAEYQFQVSTIADKVDYIPYPFQALVNMVLETKNMK